MAKQYDVLDISGAPRLYSQKVEDHFFNPRNVMQGKPKKGEFNAYGEVGSPACGDVMKLWLKIENGKITSCKWKTFGCASAIAATSVLSEMVIGKTVDEAYKITAQDIIRELGGLPQRKIHCSVLGDQALRAAIENYRQTS
jgi:nitrogen fixation NifU-like protein/NifU-like protein